MLTIAVTGGIACGKSFVCEHMVGLLPPKRVIHLDCDSIVADLFADQAVCEEVAEIEPEANLLDGDGGLRKSELRRISFRNTEFRRKLEALLHPLVLKQVLVSLEEVDDVATISIVEVPLLYEVEFPLPRDLDLVVGASREIQENRLRRRGIVDSALLEKIFESQLPVSEKMNRGDIVVWNDGGRPAVERQLENLSERCKSLFS